MTSVGSSDLEEFCDEDTSLSRGSVDLQEQLQIAVGEDDTALRENQHSLSQSNKDIDGMLS
jgi:hypothetical protein